MSQNIDVALNADIKTLFKQFAIPGMIGMLIVSFYNFIDGIFVGQLVGPEAVGAVSIAFPVVLVNQAIATMIGSGSMALFSRSIGAKDQATCNKIFGTLTISVAVLSSILVCVVYFYADGVIEVLGGKGTILVLGEQYVKILALGLIFGSVGPAVNMLLRGEGKIKDAMAIMATGMVLNIILDPVFIYGLDMGVAGAALATVISQFAIFVLSVRYVTTEKSVVPVSWHQFRLYPELLAPILSIGIGPLIMLAMIVVQQTFLFRTLSSLGGTDQLSLIGASYRVYYFTFVPMWGLSQGLLPLIGMNFGAKKYQRVFEIFQSFTLNATAIATGIWFILMIFGGTILSWFIIDPHLVESGDEYFKALNGTIFIAGLLNTPIVMFQAIGKGQKPLIILVGRQLFFFLPLLYILPQFFGIIGAWLAIPISDLFIAIIAMGLVLQEKNIILGRRHQVLAT